MARRRNISKQTRLLLAALVDAPTETWYGYDLCKKTGLKSGTLYPILMRLGDQGYLSSEWCAPEQQGRPPRRVYALTPAGLEFAQSLSSLGPKDTLPAAPKGAMA